MKPAITIANYEEFFLLYVDGELSGAEMLAVDRFVQLHPHLAEELQMLQQVKLPAEDWEFGEKELLMKPEGAEISLDNYETHFLLEIDNELDQRGKAGVEKFVLQHPDLQEQFIWLKKTKLEPETIVFPDRDTLYRKEEKQRRILYMRWQRIAVAAVFTGVIATVWTLIPSGGDHTGVPAIVRVPDKSGSQKTNKNTGNVAVTGLMGNTVTDKRTATPASPGPQIIVQKSQDAVVSNIAASQPPVNNPVVAEPREKDLTARTESQQTIITISPAANTAGIIHPPAEKTEAAGISGSMTKTETITVHNTEPENNLVQPAVYKELDTETEDNRKTLYVGSIEINKDKLRGFFRKATSLFRGKARQQEEERTENAPSSSNTRSLR